MGLLNRLFGDDPRKDLDRAAKLLEREPVRALELARKAREAGSGPDVLRRADDLITRARRAVVERAIAQADRAEASNYLDDAAEWLTSALEEAVGDQRRELEERRDGLLQTHQQKLEEARRAELRKPFDDLEAEVADARAYGGDDEDYDPELDGAFDVLAGMLTDELADRYYEQPESFRQAVVTLHEGGSEEALAVLDELIRTEPEEPALRLERGKGRLVQGDGDGARADFEVAWKHWGDGHLDLAGSQSLPGLWAEACLEAGVPEEVIGRLADASDPRQTGVDVVLPFARALMDAEKFDAAGTYLELAAQVYPKQPDFAFLLSIVLDGQGRRSEAIEVLETSVRPSCATGSCGAPPKHLPSLRALVRLLLEENELERARGYLLHVAQARGGRLGVEEHRLSADYFRRVGDEEKAAEAENTANELAAQGPEAVAEPLHSPLQSAQKERVL
ncbi:MAG: hypothetical protein MPN21_03920 [Thermoanaerobaculia bacterium]|nr:hypothetical protein [Thermoanaerobaculia bacterium]